MANNKTDQGTKEAVISPSPSPSPSLLPSIEILSEDLLCHILRLVRSSADRKRLSRVNTRWRRLERLTRTHLTIFSSIDASRLLALYPFLEHIQARQPDLAFIVASCPRLQTLELTLTLTLTLIPQTLNYLPGQSDVDDFTLGSELTEESVISLALGCPLLRLLKIPRCPAINDSGLSALSTSCPFLFHVDISECLLVSDSGLHALSSSTSLASLILKGCVFISDQGLSFLSSGKTCVSLRELDISECNRITDSGIEYLRAMHSLESLSLSKCGPKITDRSGQYTLPTMSSLRKLDLSWLTSVSDHSIVAISKGCVELRELVLTGCKLISGLGVHAFCEHMALQALVMAGCENTFDSIAFVEEVGMRCVSLEFLGLDRGLRQCMAKEALDVIERKCKIEWL